MPAQDEVSVTACTNGPLLVRGPVRMLDEHGHEIPRGRATIALCRCGVSSIKPFCDGTHKLVNFRTDDGPGAASSGAADPRAADVGADDPRTDSTAAPPR